MVDSPDFLGSQESFKYGMGRPAGSLSLGRQAAHDVENVEPPAIGSVKNGAWFGLHICLGLVQRKLRYSPHGPLTTPRSMEVTPWAARSCARW